MPGPLGPASLRADGAYRRLGRYRLRGRIPGAENALDGTASAIITAALVFSPMFFAMAGG
jgi:hypothetical protein